VAGGPDGGPQLRECVGSAERLGGRRADRDHRGAGVWWGGHPDVVEFVLPPPDARWFRAGLEAAVTVAGSLLPVWAEAGGQVIDLYVRSAWGYQGPLQPVSAERWEGGLPVPMGVAPGVYWVEFGGLLEQQYYQPRWFAVAETLVVLARAEPGGGQESGWEKRQAQFDYWWLPLPYQRGWQYAP